MPGFSLNNLKTITEKHPDLLFMLYNQETPPEEEKAEEEETEEAPAE